VENNPKPSDLLCIGQGINLNKLLRPI